MNHINKRFYLANTVTYQVERGSVTLDSVCYWHPAWFHVDEVTLIVMQYGIVDLHGNVPEIIKPIDYLPETRLQEARERRRAALAHQAQQPPQASSHHENELQPATSGDVADLQVAPQPHSASIEER